MTPIGQGCSFCTPTRITDVKHITQALCLEVQKLHPYLAKAISVR